MGTRSRIAIKKKDNTIESVYCHWDGYPLYSGYLLQTYYKNMDALKMIMLLGDISSLKERLQDSVLYNIWRNEGTYSKRFADLSEFEENIIHSDQDYAYLYDEEKDLWLYCRIPYGDGAVIEWEDLNDYLIAENIIEKWCNND